jgi:cytochrome c-type biogenesis protein CcmF
LFLMGVGPALPWGTARWSTVRERFGLPVIAGVVAVLAAWALGMREAAPLATLGLALFVAAIVGDEVVRGARARGRARGERAPVAAWRLATRNRRRYGGYVVHLGIVAMATAVAVSATMGSATTATLRPGESLTVRGYTLTYERLVSAPLADDARVIETRADVAYRGPRSGSLATALRAYPNAQAEIASPAVSTSLGEDLYVTLLAYDSATQTVTLRAVVNPLVVWIWLGGLVVGFGAVFAIWPDRRRLPSDVAVTAGVGRQGAPRVVPVAAEALVTEARADARAADVSPTLREGA